MQSYQVTLEVKRYRFHWFIQPTTVVRYVNVVVRALDEEHAEAIALTSIAGDDIASISAMNITSVPKQKFSVLIEYRVVSSITAQEREERYIREDIEAYDRLEAEKLGYIQFKRDVQPDQTETIELIDTCVLSL
jgi:hypothetical protein